MERCHFQSFFNVLTVVSEKWKVRSSLSCIFCAPIISSPELKAQWWAYRIGRPLVIRMCVCCQHFQTSSPLKPMGRLNVEAKFHMEPPWEGGTKVCSNGPGHMTKMAAMPIYGKNLKKISFPEPKVYNIGCISTTKFVQMMTLDWPWPILRQGQIRSLMLLYGKKVKKWIFRNYCCQWFETSNRWPKRQEVCVDIKILSPGGCMPPATVLYTCIKSWKNGIKSEFKEISLKLATNG